MIATQTHPRLLFGPGELEVLRAGARTGVRAEILRRLCRLCDNLLDPNHPDYFDIQERRKAHWAYRESLFMVRAALEYLPLAYAFTGEGRYGRAAHAAVMTIIRERLADAKLSYGPGGPANYPGWRHEPGHDSGTYAVVLCLTYDLAHAFFSEEDRRLFIEHARECIKLGYQQDIFGGNCRNEMNNRGTRGFMGILGMFRLTLWDEVEPHLPSEEIGQRAAVAHLYGAYDQDGAPYEGPGYGGCLAAVNDFARANARVGGPDVRACSRFERNLHYQLYELVPGGGTLNCLNDGPTITGTVAPCLFLMGTKRGELVPWLARQLDLHPARIDTMVVNSPAGVARFFLTDWDDDAPVKTPKELGYPLSHVFPQVGVACMRTGWDAEDYLLSHRAGHIKHTMHRQSDHNHLALYALGEQFLVDEGNERSSLLSAADNRPSRYFSMGDVHNIVLIDGLDQNGNQVSGGWAESRIIDWRHTPDWDASLGDAANAYGPNGAIHRALRRVVFIRNTPHPFAIVIDAVRWDESDDEHELTALWRTHETNTIHVDGSSFRIIGNNADCLGQVLYPPSPQLTVRMHHQRPQCRVRMRGSTMEMATVLTPLRRGAVAPSFKLHRHSEGDFIIDATDGPTRWIIRAGTQTTGPLNTPAPVQVNRLP